MDESPMRKVEEIVNDLYDYRDHYFERHPIGKAGEKAKNVDIKLKEATEALEKYQNACEEVDKAYFYMLKGRLLNVTPEFDNAALEALSKAVKLNPKLVDAWNDLGECYWKKDDIQAAKNCFEGALKQSKNKVSLRNLSMVLRQLGNTPQEKADNIQMGLDKAREAVQMDVEDGKSWYILGNAYLSFFFISNQNTKVLKQCMAAYGKALQDKVTQCDPYLHYNRATALRYEEDYQAALDGFCKAILYDPLWNEPKEGLQNLISYLDQVQEMTVKKGCLKGRRLQSLIKSMKKHHLGPYMEENLVNSKSAKPNLVSLNQLQPGINSQKIVLGKVVCSIAISHPIAFTFCIIDDEETCCAVTVYNLAQGRGVIIGDSIVIPEPNLKVVQLKHENKEYSYKSIRVDSPLLLVVNGKRITPDQQAPPQLKVTVTSD